MVARSFEEQGLTTTGLVLIEEHAQRVKPPRMLAVPFYFGNTLGEADNPELQHKVLQSAFDLLSKGYSLFIVSDAVGSRHINDTDSAIKRMNKRDINLVTTEMVIFELLENSKNDHFKYLSGLIK